MLFCKTITIILSVVHGIDSLPITHHNKFLSTDRKHEYRRHGRQLGAKNSQRNMIAQLLPIQRPMIMLVVYESTETYFGTEVHVLKTKNSFVKLVNPEVVSVVPRKEGNGQYSLVKFVSPEGVAVIPRREDNGQWQSNQRNGFNLHHYSPFGFSGCPPCSCPPPDNKISKKVLPEGTATVNLDGEVRTNENFNATDEERKGYAYYRSIFPFRGRCWGAKQGTKWSRAEYPE